LPKKYRQIRAFAEVVALRIDYHLITSIFFAETFAETFAEVLPNFYLNYCLQLAKKRGHHRK
jgi:hypothetical protein